MNLLEGRVAHANGAPSVVLERKDHEPIVVPAPLGADSSKLADGRKVIFGIRPEAVNDRESVDRNAKSVATFDANVEIVEPAGSDTFVVTHIAGKEVTARMRADADVRVGERHCIRVQPRQGRAVRSRDHPAHLTPATQAGRHARRRARSQKLTPRERI